MNFILAICIYIGILAGWGESYISNEGSRIYVNELAYDMGFRNGDHILSFDDYKPENFAMLQADLVRNDVSKATAAIVKWKINGLVDYDILKKVNGLGTDVRYSWAFSPKVAKQVGNLNFVICFITADENNVITNRWNSNPCSVLTVGQGIYFAEIDDAERIDDVEFDLISQEKLTEILQEVFK